MRRSPIGLAAGALALLGCSAEDVGSAKQKALQAYTRCLDQAAAKRDDGKSDATTIAKAISPLCSAEYLKVIEVNNTQNRKDFEAAMQVKQMDFATTIVLDRRKSK